MSAAYTCSRCNAECELRPMSEGSAIIAWFCPCCRCRIRTPEMIEADAERRAAERGITAEQLFEESKGLISLEPLDADALAGLQKFTAQHAQEWKPTCEHDKENPWT